MKAEDEADDLTLIIRCLEGLASPEEEEEFRRRSQDPAFLKTCLDYQLDASLLPRALLASQTTIPRESSGLSARRLRVRRPVRSRSSLWLPLLAAASVLLAAGVWLTLRPGSDLPQLVEAAPGWPAAGRSVAKGQTYQAPDSRSLKLRYPDGSTLTLAPSTCISFESRQGKRLRLLEGGLEAQIQPQAGDSPFILETGVARAQVIGTAFTLQAGANWSELKVSHGAVLFRSLGGKELMVGAGEAAIADTQEFRRRQEQPKVEKLGLVATSTSKAVPFVFKDRLYLLLCKSPAGYTLADEQGRKIRDFPQGGAIPSVLVDNGLVHIVSSLWEGDKAHQLRIASSADLVDWKERNLYRSLDEGFCHHSITKAGDRYVICLERAAPNFPARFLASSDLETFTPMPAEFQLSPGHYLAPHNFLWHKGCYYLFWIGPSPAGAAQYLSRSADLKSWQGSPKNPILQSSTLDRLIRPGRHFDSRQMEPISQQNPFDNNEIGICEFRGVTRIFFHSGGNPGFISEARYDARLGDFLESLFPKP
ncbi:MAG: hypothetical protein RL095_3193 [Verrucomicrobiota bacterium]|jgi:ferric-dicitrate binding protein FerR (iron transport regulator)